MRGLEGTSSSPLISIDIMIGENVPISEPEDSSNNFILYGSIIAAVLLTIVILLATLKSENSVGSMAVLDSDIQEVVEAEIID